MTRFRSILVATDFSAHATDAVRRAAALAEQHAARLTLLHAADPAGSTPFRKWFAPVRDVALKTAQARATLRRCAAEIAGRHGVPADVRVVVGQPFDEILRASDDADLVVLGQRGTNPLADLVTGSTADRLLRTVRRAMLVVKQPLRVRYRSILVPVDFSALSAACLRLAAAVAGTAPVDAFHALDSSLEFQLRMAGVPAGEIRERNALEDRTSQARIASIAAEAGLAAGRMRSVVRRGPASACTLEQAERLGADLIVVGKRGASAMADFLLGSVTRRLLCEATCDLMVVPAAALDALHGPKPRVSRPAAAAAH